MKPRCVIVSERVNQFDPTSPILRELRVDNVVAFDLRRNDERANEALTTIVQAVNEHAALVAVAVAANELIEEQTSLEASDDAVTEKEQTQRRHFYKSTRNAAYHKLSDAMASLSALRGGKEQKP